MPQDLSPLWISLKTSLLATFITFFLGIAAAYWMLNYRGKAKSLIESIFVAPLILPPTVVGFILLIFFGKNGPMGKLMEPLGFSVVFTWYGAAIAATVVAFPIMYKTALGAFEQIERNFLLVARTLGANEFSIFWRISLPLALPGVMAATTLAFARALGEFGATLMLAGNIPQQTQTIPMAIYFDVEAGATDEAWFWSIVIMGVSLSGIIAVNLWQERRAKIKRRDNKTRQQKAKQQAQEEINSELTNLSTGFGDADLIVDIEKILPDFHLKVSFNAAHQPLGLLGGSGAGKSMILRCIAGIETPTKGQIVLNGRILFDSDQKINVHSRDRRIGFLVQNYALFPHMTVAQNVAFGLPQALSKFTLQQRVTEQLRLVQLEELGQRYPHQLSGGQQQRVALARALASQPEALLLDEPFSALDTHLRSQLEQQMMLTLASYQGVTLFVTHNMEEAYRLCPNLLVMEQGHIAQYDSKYNIFEHPATVSVAQLTGCKNISSAIAKTSQQIEAVDWNCHLEVIEPIPSSAFRVAIRAHHILLNDKSNRENTFSCWLVRATETPHRMTLFLKLNLAPENSSDYHLQAEVLKEKWAVLKDEPQPWNICLPAPQLILLESSNH